MNVICIGEVYATGTLNTRKSHTRTYYNGGDAFQIVINCRSLHRLRLEALTNVPFEYESVLSRCIMVNVLCERTSSLLADISDMGR